MCEAGVKLAGLIRPSRLERRARVATIDIDSDG